MPARASSAAAARVEAFLRSPLAWRVAFALALLIGVATFAIGFYADDWALIATLEKRSPSQAPAYDLYRFGTGDAAAGQAMIVRGPWPWWTSPTLRLHLVRPLSSLLFALDHALFGLHAVGYHLHALLWWLSAVLAARALLRRMVAPTAAALALLLFVLDDAHVQPIGWISCRHVLVAAVPVLFGVVAHLRYRSEGWSAGRWLGPVALAVGLAGGETALGGAALVLSYELVGPVATQPLRRRLAAIAPWAVVVVGYLIAYRAVGGGASESGSYMEPFSEPLVFLGAVAVRLPTLLGDLLASIPADFSNVLARPPFVVTGALAMVGVTALCAGLWPSMSADERAAVRWLSLGALGGVAIGLAGYPGSRVLLVPSVAGFGVIALLVDRALLRSGAEAPRAGVPVRAGAWVLLALHAVVAPLLLVAAVAGTAHIARGTERVEAEMELLPPYPKRIYALTGSDPMATFYASAMRVVRHPEQMQSFSIFSMSKRTHRVTRTGPATLRLETLNGTFLDGNFVDIFRARRLGLRAGDQVQLEGATVRVLADDDGAPTAIELALDLPFEHPSIALLAWQDSRLRSLPLAIGESLDIPWTPGPTGLF
jgi:hypothetical protein